ncbi:MAG: hypothetical protein KJN71_09390 [Acidimicrobiia bacterium]|nr:hypothetical protein [Acidimicrobiia bacterium]
MTDRDQRTLDLLHGEITIDAAWLKGQIDVCGECNDDYSWLCEEHANLTVDEQAKELKRLDERVRHYEYWMSKAVDDAEQIQLFLGAAMGDIER